jgi:hypothetical protein
MRKFKFLLMLIGWCLLASSVFAAYSGKIFIYHTAISGANLGDKDSVQISVYSAKPYQDGGAGLLTVNTNYTLNRNAKYAGTTDAIEVDVLSCPGSTAYILLKTANRYATPGKPLGDPVGPDQIISSITSYKLEKPDAPVITKKEPGFETAKIEWTFNSTTPPNNFTYDGGFELEVSTQSGAGFVANRLGGVTAIVTKTSPMSYVIGELIDNRKLEPAKTYYFRMRGIVKKYVQPHLYSDYVNDSFTMKSGGGPQTFILTLESQDLNTPPGPGINNFAMPFAPDSAGKWYAPNNTTYKEITTAYSLVKAINEAALNQNVVSTFGYWDRKTQKVVGVMIPNNNPEDATAKASLQNINLIQSEGYQVYITNTQKVELLIKNTSQ